MVFDIDLYMEKLGWEIKKEQRQSTYYEKNGVFFVWNFQQEKGRLWYYYEDTGIEVILRHISMPNENFKKLVKQFLKIVCI